MPTELPERRQEEIKFPALQLYAVPACLVAVAALVETNGLWPQAIADVLLRAGEALAEAELGFLRYGAH